MDILDLYYNEDSINKLKNNHEITWIAIPFKEITMNFYYETMQLNLFQEIILRIFNCGQGNKKNIEEILRFNSVSSEQDSSGDLIDYILKELEVLGYIKDDKITKEGKEKLEDKIEEKEECGSIFYDIFSSKYVNYIYLNDDDFIKKLSISEENRFIEIGTNGSPLKIEISYFLKKEFSYTLNFEIENFLEIIQKELEAEEIKEEEEKEDERVMFNNMASSLFTSERAEKYRKKREFLKDVRKYTEKDRKDCYVLVGINSALDVKNPFYPAKTDFSLKAELEKIPEIKNLFKEKLEVKYGIGKKEKVDIKNKIQRKEEMILEKSERKLENYPELVEKLAALPVKAESYLERKREIIDFEEEDFESEIEYFENKEEIEYFENKEEIEYYKKSIKIIYECFAEAMYALFKEYGKEFAFSKERNIDKALKNILKDKYNLDEKLIHEYSYEIKSKFSSDIVYSKKLKELFMYDIVLESKTDGKKLNNFLKNNLDFFYFIKKLKNERNRFSHSDFEEYDIEEIEFDFELEAKEKLIDFIENVFKVNISDILEINILDKDLIEKVKTQSKEEVFIEFSGIDFSLIFEEILNVHSKFKNYENYKSNVEKALFIKDIGILLEKILIELRKKIAERNLCLSSEILKKEKIVLNEIAEKFLSFQKSSEKNIEEEFEKIKNEVPINIKKVKRLEHKFERGTLNNYATALLYSECNFNIKNIIEKYPEFFKLVFVVSSLRKHNGNFILKSKNSDEEIKAIKEFLEETYNILKKILKEMGE